MVIPSLRTKRPEASAETERTVRSRRPGRRRRPLRGRRLRRRSGAGCALFAMIPIRHNDNEPFSSEGVLLTCDPESETFALEELRRLFPELPPPSWLEDGTALARPACSFAEFAQTVARESPVFLRHIAPVQREVALQAEESDIELLRDAALTLTPQLDPARSFTVQSRILGEGKLPYRRFTLNATLSEALAAQTGAVQETRVPEQIVSVLCTPTTG